MRERNLKINIGGISRSRKALFSRSGIDLAGWREALDSGEEISPSALKEAVISMNIFNSVFVDCTASAEIAGLYESLFNHGVSVVAANKIAASSDYDMYRKLKETARHRNVKFLFETNVGAGTGFFRARPTHRPLRKGCNPQARNSFQGSRLQSKSGRCGRAPFHSTGVLRLLHGGVLVQTSVP